MFTNHTIDTKSHDNNCKEDYDFCNVEREQKFIINWSSPEENRFFSKRRFASPRTLSKSVPRRNKNLIRYRINRSLNFDIGGLKHDATFKSPNSSSDSSSFDGDKQLTRSAKIMRALNFNTSPLYNGRTKIKKSLNFDLSPSPKRFSNIGKHSRSSLSLSLSTPSPKLNKSLNFDESPSDTNTSSMLATSNESIDENQNQTPSQRHRKMKKSLEYLTPNVKPHSKSPDIAVLSPLLRNSLKDKIDNIVHMGATPNLHSLKRSRKRLESMDNITVSTPRNLFHDFCEEDNGRPSTPENMIRIIPESMSAIKKSHKKERLSRRGEYSTAQINAVQEKTDLFTDNQIELLQAKERPSTPQMDDKSNSSIYDVNSIKQSHKKDKSKKKLLPHTSEDEFSDTGSIFDYTEEQEHTSIKEDKQSGCDVLESTTESQEYSQDKKGMEKENYVCMIRFREDPENVDNSEICCQVEGEHKESHKRDLPSTPTVSTKIDNRPVTPQPNDNRVIDSQGVVTPENRIKFLQRLVTESIKKSHRKIKDENRKKLCRPKSLEQKLEKTKSENLDHENDNLTANKLQMKTDSTGSQNIDRAVTPENVNSSRLLLSQFSSVKKSHKKDKHNKSIPRFIKSQEYFNKNNDILKNTQPGIHDSNRFLYKTDKIDQTQHCDISPNSSSSNPEEEIDDKNMTDLSINDINRQLHGRDEKHCNKLSPSKRKNVLDEPSQSSTLSVPCSLELLSMEYNNPDEEFKIFTPIKKRKSLNMQNTVKCLSTYEASLDDSDSKNHANTTDLSRCLTPITSYHETIESSENEIFTPKKDANNRAQNSEPREPRVEQDNSEHPNGRSTPKNMSTTELLRNINSIKRSHKKDKRGNGLRRGLTLDMDKSHTNEKDDDYMVQDFKMPDIHTSPKWDSVILKNNSNRSDDVQDSDDGVKSFEVINYNDPQPSTSQNNSSSESMRRIQTEENKLLNKTPQNCLRTKSYIRLLQTTSIKKSHKKVRDQKKHNLMSDDNELSDDGSIFGEEDRLISTEAFECIQNKSNGSNGSTQAMHSAERINTSGLSNITRLSDNFPAENHQRPECKNFSGYISDDGSIFDTDEKLENMRDISNEEEGIIKSPSNTD